MKIWKQTKGLVQLSFEKLNLSGIHYLERKVNRQDSSDAYKDNWAVEVLCS